MRFVGFFEEVFSNAPEGISSGRLLDSLPDQPMSDADGIARYLKSGYELFSAMGAEVDVVRGAGWILGAASVATDGTWAWRADLSHYVARYSVELPDDFLAHVRALGYVMPEIPEQRLDELTVEILPRLGFRKDGGSGKQPS